jgi:hypothetical protein
VSSTGTPEARTRSSGKASNSLSPLPSVGVQLPLGAEILPVEHTIRRWRVGAGQHASETTGG